MKIVSIFGSENLYAVHYEGDSSHVFDMLIDNWTDPMFVDSFLTKNKKDLPKDKSIKALRDQIGRDIELIENKFNEISDNKIQSVDQFFKPLDKNDYRIVNMQLQKGRKNYFRIYAIRIDDDCYVITGGTLKFLHLMKDAKYTQDEKTRLDTCKFYLQRQSVVDAESFYCYIEEEYDE